jgi:hypothetical protein
MRLSAIPPPRRRPSPDARMKLHASVTAGLMTITAYDAGYIA